MTEKNRKKLEQKQRRQNCGKLWSGYKPLVTKTKKQKEEAIRNKYKVLAQEEKEEEK